MVDITDYEIPPEKLRWRCDPALFEFDTTKDLAPLREFVGQDRAIRAIEFGLGMDREGYNIYLAGLTGTGKTSVMKAYFQKLVQQKALAEQPQVQDWCYLYCFADPDRPQVVSLPKGQGKPFRDQISNLQKSVREELVKAFSNEEYQAMRKKTLEEGQHKQQQLFEENYEKALKQGFHLEITPMGPALVPLKDGKPITQEEFMALDEIARKELEARRAEVLSRLESTVEQVRNYEREIMEKVAQADKTLADITISRLFSAPMEQFKDSPRIAQYLADLKEYTLNNLEVFKGGAEQVLPGLGIPASFALGGRDPMTPFYVNLFVDNSATEGVPVIIEPNPNFINLLGKIERRFLLGGYLSDHRMLKPGALHLANGGYLLLSALDVLSNPGVWPALKRTIKTKEAGIEEPLEQLGLMMPQGMRPQPMPINVKIILIGEPLIYHLLATHDEDFWELFKVKADFDFELKRSEDNIKAFAAFIAGYCQECDTRHFDPTGVARVVEYASRMVADQEKLSSRFAMIKELLDESEYWAKMDGNGLVSAKHVDHAVEERRFRHDLTEEKIREMIGQGTIMIDLDGSEVGQVNGLSVISLGDTTFGRPSRITCKTFLGRGGVVNIERESELSGRIHDKGVLILSGYLGAKYAQEHPLALSASLCFEQSYEGVEGDSASSAELYALLSSIAETPLRQDIAVTGSVNQKGEVQAIGGVNQKIEGFFKVCQAKGLTGHQGVMIPAANLRNLMLRDEVIEAVREGKFHVYTVNTIDDGIQILTGIEVGEKGADGTYPAGTVNRSVAENLKEFATRLKSFYGNGAMSPNGEAEEAKATKGKAR